MAIDRPAVNRYSSRRGKSNKVVVHGRTPRSAHTIVDQLEQAADAASGHIVNDIQQVLKAMGPRPFGASKSDATHELEAYAALDPVSWGALIQEKGIVAVLHYAVRMEELRARRRAKNGTAEDYT